MSQSEQILRDLQAGERITPLDAIKRYSCLRLSGRILELREKGHTICTEMVRKNGKSYARYYMPKSTRTNKSNGAIS